MIPVSSYTRMTKNGVVNVQSHSRKGDKKMKRPAHMGVSFSWSRALGITALKERIARKLGIPLTRSGLERMIGRKLLPKIRRR